MDVGEHEQQGVYRHGHADRRADRDRPADPYAVEPWGGEQQDADQRDGDEPEHLESAQHPAHPFEISPGVGVGECRPERVEDEHSYHVDAVEVFVGYVVFGHRVRPDVA